MRRVLELLEELDVDDRLELVGIATVLELDERLDMEEEDPELELADDELEDDELDSNSVSTDSTTKSAPDLLQATPIT